MDIKKQYYNTKYGIVYIKIIQKALKQNRVKLKKNSGGYVYYEAHHILPKSLFKEYSDLKIHKWNKVLLTAREHFICHILLVKHYRKIKNTDADIKMSKAIRRLSQDGKHNSKLYEKLKLNLSCSNGTKAKIGQANKGNIPSKEARLKMSIAGKGRIHSPETITKMKKPKTKQHKLNISKAKNNKIEIYDNNNILRYRNDINFFEFCKINNLPGRAFKTSYLNEVKLFTTKNGEIQAIKNGTIKYKGWYAKKI